MVRTEINKAACCVIRVRRQLSHRIVCFLQNCLELNCLLLQSQIKQSQIKQGQMMQG